MNGFLFPFSRAALEHGPQVYGGVDPLAVTRSLFPRTLSEGAD
jgi:hypothetical protein